ncbi:uncharacterized protein PGTG_21621 [Puccinia graminis f. sp. tritici CRL 75-36-700-3]|uniref:hexokinase n=1 Tax=Puccinia graminis f. sp. tritici (strain CRL 75-36-700-3 / race SCCL) TaxID=418459 RepID=H6QRM2_PUCGT|nr:uncharacterized protein PGTG_21621 [Puccinia graminis f. sp. tritici CRL 75-36-700-3]EHS63316.1 hypothetical protein PGTG_21621 [Puccinia graminis f. sp. tritici CRL 75-36-700-3]
MADFRHSPRQLVGYIRKIVPDPRNPAISTPSNPSPLNCSHPPEAITPKRNSTIKTSQPSSNSCVLPGHDGQFTFTSLLPSTSQQPSGSANRSNQITSEPHLPSGQGRQLIFTSLLPSSSQSSPVGPDQELIRLKSLLQRARPCRSCKSVIETTPPVSPDQIHHYCPMCCEVICKGCMNVTGCDWSCSGPFHGQDCPTIKCCATGRASIWIELLGQLDSCFLMNQYKISFKHGPKITHLYGDEALVEYMNAANGLLIASGDDDERLGYLGSILISSTLIDVLSQTFLCSPLLSWHFRAELFLSTISVVQGILQKLDQPWKILNSEFVKSSTTGISPLDHRQHKIIWNKISEKDHRPNSTETKLEKLQDSFPGLMADVEEILHNRRKPMIIYHSALPSLRQSINQNSTRSLSSDHQSTQACTVVPTPLTSVSSNAQHGSTSSDPTFRKSATFTRRSGSRADGRGSIVVHTRTHDNAQLPHATKMQMADYLRKFEHLFMVTPQRFERGWTPMIPTFVFGWPTGKEVGPYLAVDLGKLMPSTHHANRCQLRDMFLKLGRYQFAFAGPELNIIDFLSSGIRVQLTSLMVVSLATLVVSFLSLRKPFSEFPSLLGAIAASTKKVANIPKIASLGLPPDAEMAITCEWGAFDFGTPEHLPRTKYDLVIDETSNKPGEQAFEKMIAGLYLGEAFRLTVGEMIEEGILFLGQNTYKMEKSYCFDTAFLSLIESDPTEELLTVTGLFTHFFGLDTTISERQFFRRLAELIGTRSARLSACGIAAIVSKMGMVETGCGVATDGSLYNKYPQFPQRLHEALVDIFGEKGRLIKTYHAEDGRGVGSAIIAAMTKARLAEGKFTHV